MMSNLGGRVKTRKLVKTWFSEKKQNIMCFSVQWDNPSISTRPDWLFILDEVQKQFSDTL